MKCSLKFITCVFFYGWDWFLLEFWWINFNFYFLSSKEANLPKLLIFFFDLNSVSLKKFTDDKGDLISKKNHPSFNSILKLFRRPSSRSNTQGLETSPPIPVHPSLFLSLSFIKILSLLILLIQIVFLYCRLTDISFLCIS